MSGLGLTQGRDLAGKGSEALQDAAVKVTMCGVTLHIEKLGVKAELLLAGANQGTLRQGVVDV